MGDCLGKQAALQWFSQTPLHKPSRPNIVLDNKSNLADLVLQKFDENGDRIALVDGATGAATTFKELKDKIYRCAAAWQARGVRKGDIIAMYAPNLPDWAVCFHGALLCGAIPTTLNPAYGASEIEHALTISKATRMVTVPSLLEAAKTAAQKACPGQIKEFFTFGESGNATPFSEFIASQDPATFEPVNVDAEKDIAVLPYSSGTTGLPKAVMLTHFNMSSNMLQIEACADITKDDVLCAILPFFHIYGMTVILNTALHMGAKIVTMAKFDPAEYLKNLKTHSVTIAHVAPPVVNFLAKHPAVDNALPLPALKELFCGAAPLGQELASAAKERLQLESVRQGYGMTEMAPASHAAVRGTAKHGSIGRLVPNMVCRIVDPETGVDKGVGEGEVGEIWLKGPNVMPGYLDAPEATAETIDRDGFIHTGDIGYVDADGDFWIVDRLKELIKVKGFQVAPAELEALLTEHEEIMDAAVIGIAASREGDGQVPKAFVVKKAGSQLTEDAIMAWVKERVVAYKALGQVQFVDAVPKSASGKILRKDLRAQEGKTFA